MHFSPLSNQEESGEDSSYASEDENFENDWETTSSKQSVKNFANTIRFACVQISPNYQVTDFVMQDFAKSSKFLLR